MLAPVADLPGGRFDSVAVIGEIVIVPMDDNFANTAGRLASVAATVAAIAKQS